MSNLLPHRKLAYSQGILQSEVCPITTMTYTDSEQRYALLIELSRGYYRSGHVAEPLRKDRSLLVTQWAVESQSAKQLTVGMF